MFNKYLFLLKNSSISDEIIEESSEEATEPLKKVEQPINTEESNKE